MMTDAVAACSQYCMLGAPSLLGLLVYKGQQPTLGARRPQRYSKDRAEHAPITPAAASDVAKGRPACSTPLGLGSQQPLGQCA